MPPSSSNDAQARGRAQSGTPPPQLASHQSVHPPASGPPRELPLGAATTTWPTDDGRAEPQSGVGWLNSVSDLGAMAAEGDEVEDRGDFVLEYNRLAKEVRLRDPHAVPRRATGLVRS